MNTFYLTLTAIVLCAISFTAGAFFMWKLWQEANDELLNTIRRPR